LQEFAHVAAARGQQKPSTLFQELGELEYVGGIRADGKPRQTFLDAQVIEKP